MIELNLPETWIKTSLSEITFKITDGSHNPPPKQSEGLPMLSAQNILNNEIVFENYRLIEESAFEEECKRANVEANDVLLTIVGTIGRAAIVPFNLPRFTLQRSVALIKPAIISAKWLTYYLQSRICQNFFSLSEKGTAQKGVYLGSLKILPVHLAPIKEQHRIVAKIEELFSELDNGVETLNKAKQQLKIYRQAVLKSAFEGELTRTRRGSGNYPRVDNLIKEVKALGAKNNVKLKYTSVDVNETLPPIPSKWMWLRNEELLKYVTSGSRDWKKYYSNAGSIFIRTQDIKTNALDLTGSAFVKLPDKVEGKRSLVQSGDLLMTITGANVGKVAVSPENIPEAYVSQSVALMKLLDVRMSKYLWYYFQSRTYGEGLVGGLVYGVGRPVLSLENMREVPVAICTIEEQMDIVEQIESRFSVSDKIEESIEQGLKQAEALRQSILKRAFEGKLVPQDVRDENASILLERIKAERAESQPQKKIKAKKNK